MHCQRTVGGWGSKSRDSGTHQPLGRAAPPVCQDVLASMIEGNRVGMNIPSSGLAVLDPEGVDG